jgi:hypothetical protein
MSTRFMQALSRLVYNHPLPSQSSTATTIPIDGCGMKIIPVQLNIHKNDFPRVTYITIVVYLGMESTR